MVAWRKKNYTASLSPQSYTSTGGEETWQTRVRQHDLDYNGLLGYSLDMVASVASSATIFPIVNGKEKTNNIDTSKLDHFVGAYGQSLQDLIYSAVRALMLLGEFDLVYVNNSWTIFYTYQRLKTRIIEDTPFIEYALSDKKDNTVLVSEKDVVRVVNPRYGQVWEAHSPTRRILPLLDTYKNIVDQLSVQAKSNKSFPKIAWFGSDDGRWRNETIVEDGGQKLSAPPILSDAVGLSKRIREDDQFAPFFPMMSDTKPEVVDLSTPLDGSIVNILDQLTGLIAQGLNIPARLLTGDGGNHWSDWLLDSQLKQFAVEPLLRIVIFNFSKKFKPTLGFGIGYRFDDKGDIDVKQALEAYKAGVVNADYVRYIMEVGEEYVPSAEDLILLQKMNIKSDNSSSGVFNG